MDDPRRGPHSLARLFVSRATIALVPVMVLGAVLAWSYRVEARQRGVAEGRSQAALVAETAIEPQLDGRLLSNGLSPAENLAMRQLVARAVSEKDVLRLRLRDLAGRVVFSDDGSGYGDRPEDEALDAAGGEVVARLTRLNADSNDTGPLGVAAVEVYLPLTAGSPARRVGVVEVYLPYAPISHDVTAGLHRLYLDLGIGLALLYLALFVISMSVSQGLRREVRLNAFLAEHDPLTELPNRALFHRRAAATLDLARRRGQTAVVAIVDLDRFKEVNDTLGHHNGDRVLTELAQRLAAHVRPIDTVARLGGDEFGLVLLDTGDAEAALWRLRQVIDGEIQVEGLPLSMEASIGFVVAPDDGSGVDELLQRADVAMYLAKAQHAGVMRYDPAQDLYDTGNLALISELRHAIAADQLVLHYQPKVRVSDGSVEAVEALVRWQHPTLGLIYPDRFIPLAEQTDLIDGLTGWVLTAALTEMGSLPPAWAGLTVAVNVSARNLARPDFAEQVVAILDRVGVSPERLIVELTETGLLADPDRAARVLAELASAGVLASLDDFGQGQTSLGYLSQLPVHELKIDKSFVFDMLVEPAHAAIVRSIVDIGHNLGCKVVAEGVETEDVLAGLRAAGCDVAQGYLFARPMPAERLQEWLAGATAAASAQGYESRLLVEADLRAR